MRSNSTTPTPGAGSLKSTHLIPRENVFLIPNNCRNNSTSTSTSNSNTKGAAIATADEAMPFSCYRQVRDKYYSPDVFRGLCFKVRYHQFTSTDHVLKCPDSSKNQERIFVRGDIVNVFLPPATVGAPDTSAADPVKATLDAPDDCVWFVVVKAKRNFSNKLWRRSFSSIYPALDAKSLKIVEDFFPIMEYGRVNREPKVKSKPTDSDLHSSSTSTSTQQLSGSLDGGGCGGVGDTGLSGCIPDEQLARLLKTSLVLARLVSVRKDTVVPPPASPAPLQQLHETSNTDKLLERRPPPLATSPSLSTLITASSNAQRVEVKKELNCDPHRECNNTTEDIIDEAGKIIIYSPLLKPSCSGKPQQQQLTELTTTTTSEQAQDASQCCSFGPPQQPPTVQTTKQNTTKEVCKSEPETTLFTGSAGSIMSHEVECFKINPVPGKSLWVECGLYPIFRDSELVYPGVDSMHCVIKSNTNSNINCSEICDSTMLFDSLVSVSQECLNSPSFNNPPK